MAYTKKQFAAELILELEKGYNKEKISKWADKIYHQHIREIDDKLNDVIQKISLMSFGEQFEYTENELIELAIKLIRNDDSL